MKQPGRRISLHVIPPYCPHLNPIERLWGAMHKHVKHNRFYATFKDFAEAVPTFLTQTVPKHFDQFSSRITDNFRVLDPKNFRILT
jgi:transposase